MVIVGCILEYYNVHRLCHKKIKVYVANILLIVNKMLLILVISIIMATVQLMLCMAIGITEAQPELPKTYKMAHFATIDNGLFSV